MIVYSFQTDAAVATSQAQSTTGQLDSLPKAYEGIFLNVPNGFKFGASSSIRLWVNGAGSTQFGLAAFESAIDSNNNYSGRTIGESSDGYIYYAVSVVGTVVGKCKTAYLDGTLDPRTFQL
jgi:hypothetical protein